MSDVLETGEFKLANSTSHLLHRAQQLASDRFALLVGDNGVTLRQFAVLAAIAESPGLSQTELVRATGIDRSTLADMMPRMEQRGWIARSARDSDARAKSVRLAKDGATVLAAARQHAKAADAAILDALPKPKRKAFHATLLRLAEIADQSIAANDRAERKAVKHKAKRDAKSRDRIKKKRRREARADAVELIGARTEPANNKS